MYPYISKTGNFDVHDDAEFLRPDDTNDVEVDNLDMISKTSFGEVLNKMM